LVDSGDRALAAAESRRAYERVIQEFADQAEPVTTARARLSALNAEASNGKIVVRSLAEADYFVTSASHDGRYATIRRSSGYYVYDRATHTERSVASVRRADSVEMGPAIISDDSRQLAYTTEDRSDSDPSRVHYRIRVIGMDGRGDRLLWEDATSFEHLALFDWSPAGDRILAVARDADQVCQILLVNTSNGSGTVRYRLPVGPYSRDIVALFSQDGQYIVFSQRTDREAPRDILSMPVDGGGPSPLITHPADDSPVGWTADGRLVFESDRAAATGIWTVQVRNGRAIGEPEALKRDIGQAPSNGPVFGVSPVGFGRDGSFFFRVRTRPREVYTATLDLGSGGLASDLAPLSPNRFVGVNGFPDFSPDGRILAYVTGPDDSKTIQFRNLETGEERAVPQPVPLESIYDLRWFPDGRELLLSGRQPDDTLVFFRMDVETGEGSVLLDENITSSAATNPTFDPNGEWLYFKTRLGDETTARIVRYQLANGKLETVVEPSGDSRMRLFALSPDGQQLAIIRRDEGHVMEVRPVAGGPARTVYTYPEGAWTRGWGSLASTADGKAILYSQIIGNDFYDDALLVTPLDGGPTRRLADTKMIYRIRAHPDGRRIALMTQNFHYELWVAENLAPAQTAAR